MKKLRLIILVPLAIISFLVHAQNSSICGTVLDNTTNEPVMFANVALYQNGTLLTGMETDLDGCYCFEFLHPGNYAIEASFIGYATLRQSDITIKQNNELANINIRITEGGMNLDEVVVVAYKKPLIKQDCSTQGTTVTASEIRKLPYRHSTRKSYRKAKKNAKQNLPTRSINGLASTSAGVGASDNGQNVTVRSGRTDEDVYYIDGVQVRGNLIPESELNQQQLILSGTPASGEKEETQKAATPIKKPSTPEIAHIPTREDYSIIKENEFQFTKSSPLSTFSIDVDRAAYSNLRRFINQGQMPPADALRIEEMINYFNYDYKQPIEGEAFSVNTEYSDCPWNKKAKLLHIGVQGREVPQEDIPDANLVFLVDVSGSMNSRDKLPLVKESLHLLVDKLKPTDRIALVTYAGATRLVLPPTEVSQKPAIKTAIQNLGAGGSTAGASGIKLAYETARKHFMPKGNNRIILATDGDFNVGVSSNSELQRIIEKEREHGIFLSILGFGTGNYQDSKMQMLADHGNGNHAYIDQIKEAEKVLVKEMAGTLLTIAKDVKIQIEFNPQTVASYRLIGYENRMLAAEDFNNDKKDAGELGSGHTVTAIYEVIPKKKRQKSPENVDALKYQTLQAIANNYTDELATIKLRYKKPLGVKSKLISHIITTADTDLEVTSNNYKWAAAIAQFGMTIRSSKYLDKRDYNDVLALAESGLGTDANGYRDEAIQMMQRMMEIHDPSMSKK